MGKQGQHSFAYPLLQESTIPNVTSTIEGKMVGRKGRGGDHRDIMVGNGSDELVDNKMSKGCKAIMAMTQNNHSLSDLKVF